MVARAYVVCAPLGNPGLLGARGARWLALAKGLFVDADVAPSVLALAPSTAPRSTVSLEPEAALHVAVAASAHAASLNLAPIVWVVGPSRCAPGPLRAAISTLRQAGVACLLAPAVPWSEEAACRDALGPAARPLEGARILVTRPEAAFDPLATRLEDEGATPLRAPAIALEAPTDPTPFRRAVASLDTFDWVVLTSANGVRALFAELTRTGRDARAFGAARVAAIGPRTAEALAAHGLRADLVPDEFRGEAVGEALLAAADRAPSALKVLLPRAEVAREALPALLAERGVAVTVVPSYLSVAVSEDARLHLASAVREGAVDVVTLTAPSTLERLLEALGPDGPAALARLVVASIGPVTSEAAARAGVRVDVSAARYTADGLVDALVAWAAAAGWPERRADGPHATVVEP